MVALRILCIVFLFTLTATGVGKTEIAQFHVSQAFVEIPKITVYLHINDLEGNPVTEIGNTKLTARVGSNALEVKNFKPFNSAQEGVAVIFLIDISKSLSASQFTSIKKAVSIWVDAMTEKDSASIMSFGTNVKVLQDFTSNKQILNSVINGLALTDMDTQLHLGLVRAIEAGRRKDADLPFRKAIIVLSDGHDDFAGGLTKEEVLLQMKDDPIPVYAIGFYRPPKTSKKESYLKIMGQFARTSGGNYFKASSLASLNDIYKKVRNNIQNVWAASLTCSTCNDDGIISRLQVNLTIDKKTISDGINIRMLPKIETQTPEPEASSLTPENQNEQASEEQNEQTPEEQNEQAPEEQNEQAPEEQNEQTPEEQNEQTPEEQNSTEDVIAQEQVADVPSETPKLFWEKRPVWTYFAAGIVVLLLFWILISVKRKKNIETQTNSLKSEISGMNEQKTVGGYKADKDEIKETLSNKIDSPQITSPTPLKKTSLKIKLIMMGHDSREDTYQYYISDKLIIGRDKNACDIFIENDDEISGVHCELQLIDKTVSIKDLNSTNGVLVNGIPITNVYYLQNKDTLLIGRTEMRILF